jgi:C4-dicarboxylate-specific signal transduction histidine kinase
LIEDRYGDQEDLVRMAGFARTTHERLVQIINEVKAFVRFEREEVVTQRLELSEVVHELIEFLRYERSLPLDRFEARVECQLSVKAHRVKLQQVLLNLLKNAAHAIRGRQDGKISLVVSAEDREALITVTDNGCGMTADVAQRIWEPFFTTKGEEGTGVGLDVARSIIEAHGGSIHCESAPDQGARFTIRLPKWDSIEKDDASAAPRAVAAATWTAGPLLTPAPAH